MTSLFGGDDDAWAYNDRFLADRRRTYLNVCRYTAITHRLAAPLGIDDCWH